MGEIENQLKKRLKATFKIFITHALEHSLCEEPTEER